MKNILFLWGVLFFYTVSWGDQSSEGENSVNPLILKELGKLHGISDYAHDHAKKLKDSTVSDHNILAEEVNGFVDAIIIYIEKNENNERGIDREKDSLNARAGGLQLKIKEDLNPPSSKDKKMGTDPYSKSLDKSFSSRVGGVGGAIIGEIITSDAIHGLFSKVLKYFNNKAARDYFIKKLESLKWKRITP